MRSEFAAHSLVAHARCALRDNLRVEPGEVLTVVWDETVTPSLYEALRIAADDLGIEAVAVTYEPVAYRPINEYGLFAGRSLQPPLPIPAVLLGALQASDTFVLLCSDTELLFSPDLKAILTAGKRGLFLPYLDSFSAERMLFTSSEEVEEQYQLVQAVGDLFEGTHEVHVSSAEGTDLRLRLGERKVLRRKGITYPGELMFLPAGNVARVPDDGSAEGVLMIDRTVCADDYKELHETIALQVRGGRVVAIEGGMEARLLRDFLSSLDDERAYHLTELAVGTNPLCKWSGIGAPSEDTHVHGTVAFALGCDTHIGGSTPAPVHIDMTMRFPSLKIGATDIVRDGRLLVTGQEPHE